MTAPLDELARLAQRLGDLRGRAARGPLPAPSLRELERTAAGLTAVIPRLAAEAAALDKSRGLALEATRAGLAQARRLDLDAAMAVVTARRAAGQIRGAARAYWQLLRRAPRDAVWKDRLAGFGHLLEEFGEGRGAGRCRTLAASLFDGWWRDAMTVEVADEALALVDPDWARLPEAV